MMRTLDRIPDAETRATIDAVTARRHELTIATGNDASDPMTAATINAVTAALEEGLANGHLAGLNAPPSQVDKK